MICCHNFHPYAYYQTGSTQKTHIEILTSHISKTLASYVPGSVIETVAKFPASGLVVLQVTGSAT